MVSSAPDFAHGLLALLALRLAPTGQEHLPCHALLFASRANEPTTWGMPGTARSG